MKIKQYGRLIGRTLGAELGPENILELREYSAHLRIPSLGVERGAGE